MYTAYLALFQAEAELEEELPYLWHKACCLGRKGSKGRGQRGRRELNMSPQPGHLLALTWLHTQEGCLPEWTSGDLGRSPVTTPFLLLSPQGFWDQSTSV